MDTRGWYVLKVYSSYENIVKKKLLDMIENGEIENIYDIKIPVQKSTEIRKLKNGKEKRLEVERKIIPGYILLDMDRPAMTWKDFYKLLRKVQGVSGFPGTDKDNLKPRPISNQEYKQLYEKIENNKTTTKTYHQSIYEIGMAVKVSSGPFQNFTGKITEIEQNKNKLKIEVEILGRSTPIEVSFDQVEKITN